MRQPFAVTGLTGLLGLALMTGCSPTAQKPIPATIEGASMAPNLLGDHLHAACPDCKYEFRSEIVAADKTLACPNCGLSEISVDQAELTPATKVNLTPGNGQPKRWQVVGFNIEGKDAQGVKRVVGLPNEIIEIFDGELFSGDKLLRKPFESQREIRIPVFDSNHLAQPPFDLPHRFIAPEIGAENTAAADVVGSGWDVTESTLRFEQPDQETTSSLAYQHWRGFKHRGERDAVVEIEDSYAFNQSINRNLLHVEDLFLQLDVSFESPSDFGWTYHRGETTHTFSLAWQADLESWSLTHAMTTIANDSGEPTQPSFIRKPLTYSKHFSPLEPGELKVEFSSFDRTLVVALDGNVQFQLLEEADREQFASTDRTENIEEKAKLQTPTPAIVLNGHGGSFSIQRLQIWRDIYYLAAPDGYEAKSNLLKAGDSQLILLGDNSPRSLDSRTWKSPGLAIGNVIGVVEAISEDAETDAETEPDAGLMN